MTTTPETFREGPVGWWSTLETLPFGEAVGFYAKGLGVHRSYCGLGCTETYFEWQSAGNFRIRVRWLDDPDAPPGNEDEEQYEFDADEDIDADRWELVPFSVVEGTTPYGNRNLHLSVLCGPLLNLEELWYSCPLPDRPVSRWTPPAAMPSTKEQTNGGNWLTIGQITGLIVGLVCAIAWLFALINPR